MTTPYNQMVASLLADTLNEQLAAFDAGDSAGTWFASATHALAPKDFDKFVAACRKRAEKLAKEADGCPPKIFGWVEHFGAE